MERESVIVRSGHQYDHYFPKAQGRTLLKKKGAGVSDTLALIPDIVRLSAAQNRKFSLEVIKGASVEDSCHTLWNFVYQHIAYKKDDEGKEQVRDAARTWHDRHNVNPLTGEPSGVDCDCRPVFVASVLYNLGIKQVYFRITKYPSQGKRASEISWSHIYPIVILPNGRQITLDGVVHQFNYEEPYLEKKDTPMDLEYLNGLPINDLRASSMDAQEFMGLMDEQTSLSDLGKLFKRKAKNNDSGGASKPKKKGKVKAFLKKGLHVTNRLNPATVALRNGVLAAMKLNFMKIGSSLRYAYLTDEQAQSKGLIVDKVRKLRSIREKLEKIFYGAGGKPENLKKAILKGRGNKDKAVPLNGLDYVPYESTDGLHEDMPLRQLLGNDLYHSENVDGMEGFAGFGQVGQLGEPATAATIAAATTVLTTIAALIKSVGSVFPNKGGAKKQSFLKRGSSGGGGGGGSEAGGSEAGSGDEGSGNSSSEGDSGGDEPSSDNSSDSSSQDSGSGSESSGGEESEGATNGSGAKARTAGNSSDEEAGEDTPSNKPALRTASPASTSKAASFWENNKTWAKPVGIGVGALGLVALVYKLSHAKPTSSSLNGPPKKRKSKPKPKSHPFAGVKKKKGGTRRRKTTKKKHIITLL